MKVRYLARLMEGHGRSFVLLNRSLRKPTDPLKRRTAVARLLHRLRTTGRAGAITWFWDLGYAAEKRKIALGECPMGGDLLKFSIVIPNFNSGSQLERAIVSLLNQDYPNLQLILADAESTDESRLTIEKYRDRFDTVLIGKDQGQADGLNRGFRCAAGEIHGWLCADDELLPGTLRHVNELFTANPDAGVVTGSCQRLFADGSSSIVAANPDPWERIHIQNVIEQPSTFWRGSVHRDVGELDHRYRLAFDWDLWNRFRKSGAKIISTDRVLSNYYFSDSNKSGNSGRGHVTESFKIVEKYGPFGLAHLFRFLYFTFDLHGCYDNPPTCGLLRSHVFIWTLATLRAIIGKRLLYSYNWHFASCQERGLKWW
jgi:glycosyltransferase involved in cell wall biosynthesis